MVVVKPPDSAYNFRCLYDTLHVSRFNHNLIRVGWLMTSKTIWVLLGMHEFEIIRNLGIGNKIHFSVSHKMNWVFISLYESYKEHNPSINYDDYNCMKYRDFRTITNSTINEKEKVNWKKVNVYVHIFHIRLLGTIIVIKHIFGLESMEW